MVLFWPIQQELDCINLNGDILGKIRFDALRNSHTFLPANTSRPLSSQEEADISKRIECLDTGKNSIPMQDDD